MALQVRKIGESWFQMPSKLSYSCVAGDKPDDGVPLDLAVAPNDILRFLLACIGLLILAGSMVAIASAGFGEQNRITQLFDLDAELSIPAYFSSLMLLAAGCLLGFIAFEHTRRGRGWHLHWSLLALGFVWLAFDEAAQIHEALNLIVRTYLGMSYLGGVAWTVPMVVVVAVLATLYLPFVRALPRRYVLLFVASGLLYLGGAIGVEFVGGMLKDRYGAMSWLYQIEVVVEEGCEMLGAAIFIYSLATYMAELGVVVQLRMLQQANRRS
jgi:hypothetical protein